MCYNPTIHLFTAFIECIKTVIYALHLNNLNDFYVRCSYICRAVARLSHSVDKMRTLHQSFIIFLKILSFSSTFLYSLRLPLPGGWIEHPERPFATPLDIYENTLNASCNWLLSIIITYLPYLCNVFITMLKLPNVLKPLGKCNAQNNTIMARTKCDKHHMNELFI